MTRELPAARLSSHLAFLYGERADAVLPRLLERLEAFRRDHPEVAARAPAETTQDDVVLITYADQVRAEGQAPLRTLHRFAARRLANAVNTVHLLPFYPSTSDDGFSVVDYLAVDPALGDWSDVTAFGKDFALMFDAVINHVSASSRWFQGFLAGEDPYVDYFLDVPPGTDLSTVVRPRTLPLLTAFETARGTRHVWTTFSADQVDLNYHTPEVLLDVVDVILTYVARGARILRLDAITFLWKEIGTACVHHPKTHRVIQLLRTVVDAVAPDVVLLTETNVPHAENVSYFGNGHDEAHMVYNFALPPLTLHAFASGDARPLRAWAASLDTPSDATTFFNFLASHDGIGVRPVERILALEQVAALVERTLRHGGRVSYRSKAGGRQVPYELNISYFDALSDPAADEPLERQVDRFVAAHAIAASLAGVPGVYVHSLLGSRSDHEAVERTGVARAINRARFDLRTLDRELDDPASLRHQVWRRLSRLYAVRRAEPAFHPQASQEVLPAPDGVFAVRRGARLTCLANVTDRPQDVEVSEGARRDLLTGAASPAEARRHVLPPYGVAWLAG
jgi:glucosylglycerate phosphorylase